MKHVFCSCINGRTNSILHYKDISFIKSKNFKISHSVNFKISHSVLIRTNISSLGNSKNTPINFISIMSFKRK